MKRFSNLFAVFAISLFVASIVYYVSIDKLIPKVSYKNFIEFDLAYLNHDDVLAYHQLPYVSEYAQVTKLDISKSDELRTIHIEIPFQYEPFFKLSFGESSQVDFKLANLKINNEFVPIEKISEALTELGYKVDNTNGILYVNYAPTYAFFDLYKIAKEKFVFMSQEEVAKLINDDDNLRRCVFIFIVVITLFVFRLLNFAKIIYQSNTFTFNLYLFLYILLLLFSILLVYYNELRNCKENILFLLKNYVPIILFPLTLCLFFYNFNKIVRIFVFAFSLFFIFIIGVDHFIQSLLDTRFLFDSVGAFTGNLLGAVMEGIPFISKYIESYCGFYFILSIIFFTLFYWTKFDLGFIHIVRMFSFLCLILSVCLMFVGNTGDKFVFFNTFQVNSYGLYTNGDNKRKYYSYKVYDMPDLEYMSYKGLNLRKNIIVLLVESLSCENTFLCGNKKNSMIGLNHLANKNVFFSSYYSNNVNTNGALFTITTGFPLIVGPNIQNTYTNRLFYQKDLINKFHENGYLTFYYSPASVVLEKEQLLISKYDYINDANDEYYKNIVKPGVFNSVSDGDMFDKIVYDLKNKKERPVFIMLTTLSTHTPYMTPWGNNNSERAFEYSDFTINKFINDLNDIHYFDDGIVIITGDHREWGNKDADISKQVKSRISREHLPLIMIDGQNHNVVWNRVSFSHSSLGVMLEYLMLPSYEKNKFQVNPLIESKNETILYHNLNNANRVIVKFGEKEDEILLDGDQTRFIGEQFSDMEQQSILGYISWLKR